jgi:hypothetical protein
MRDTLARGLALDNFGGLEKLLVLFFGQRVSSVACAANEIVTQARTTKNDLVKALGNSCIGSPRDIAPDRAPLTRAKTTPLGFGGRGRMKVPFAADLSLLFSGAGLSSRHEANPS